MWCRENRVCIAVLSAAATRRTRTASSTLVFRPLRRTGFGCERAAQNMSMPSIRQLWPLRIVTVRSPGGCDPHHIGIQILPGMPSFARCGGGGGPATRPSFVGRRPLLPQAPLFGGAPPPPPPPPPPRGGVAGNGPPPPFSLLL